MNDYWLANPSVRLIQEQRYGRGLTHPYQFFMDNSGRLIENYFGEARLVGQVENHESLMQTIRDSMRPSFSLRALANVQEIKPEKVITYISTSKFIESIMPDIHLLEYQRRILDNIYYVPSRQCCRTSWLIKFLQYIEEGQKKSKLELPLVKIDSVNRNKRTYSQQYFDEYSFDLGERIFSYKKYPITLEQYLAETKYDSIAIMDTTIPKIKINIKLRRNPYEKEK